MCVAPFLSCDAGVTETVTGIVSGSVSGLATGTESGTGTGSMGVMQQLMQGVRSPASAAYHQLQAPQALHRLTGEALLACTPEGRFYQIGSCKAALQG